MAEYPFIIGNNAAGFPHFFSEPRVHYLFSLEWTHLRVIYGRLDQSEYSPLTVPKYYASRLETGSGSFRERVVATFQPRGFDGLEIGGSRFIILVWPRTGIPASYLGNLSRLSSKPACPASSSSLREPTTNSPHFSPAGRSGNRDSRYTGSTVAEDHSYDQARLRSGAGSLARVLAGHGQSIRISGCLGSSLASGS